MSRHLLCTATSNKSQHSAIKIVVSQSNAILTFLTTMPASLRLDLENVGQIKNVEIAVQKVELVLEGWGGIIRMWRHLLAAEARLVTSAPPTPSDTLEPVPSPHSGASPSALDEPFPRCAIMRATEPCNEFITLLHAQVKIVMTEPRFHYYLYAQGVPRRSFHSGLVLARIITLCEEEQDRTMASTALGALQLAVDLVEQVASWFSEQSGESTVVEGETLKLLRMLLAHAKNRVELLDVKSSGSKRSREVMEATSDISAARLGDLHGLRLPFTPDVLILDPVHSPSMTQQTGAQSAFHCHLAEPLPKSIPSGLAPSPSSAILSNSIDTNVVPEPSPSLPADDPATCQRKPTPGRPFGRPSPPVLLNGEPHGEGTEVERGSMPKLRKIQPRGSEPQAGEIDLRASQATHEVRMDLDPVSPVSFNVQDGRSQEQHSQQAWQEQPLHNAFATTSSHTGTSHGGLMSHHPAPVLGVGHSWHGFPALTPVGVPEAYAQLHANPWPLMTGPTTTGIVLYPEEPYPSLGMAPMSFAPAASASAPLLHASMDDNPAVAHPPYPSYPGVVPTTAAATGSSPAQSLFSSSYGPSPLPPSVPSLHNAPTPDSIPQPSPRAPLPQHLLQQRWHYEAHHASN
jgi:hypothetical protein